MDRWIDGSMEVCFVSIRGHEVIGAMDGASNSRVGYG
jgi:hypothetical protein